jgi:soluble cytochrome b562
MELAYQESFLPLSAHRAMFSEIEETHSVMNALLVSLAQEVRPKRFLEDLDAFRRNGVAFDELYRKLKTFEQSKLAGSPNFQKLLDTMKQVYLEEAPDDRLREFLPFLRSSHEDFLRRLEGVSGEDHDLARECLEEHRRAFLELEEYLRDGDRSRVLHAYELILPACIDLEELEQAARDDTVDILEGEPVQRQSRALQQVVAIVKAYRCGQLKQDECLSTLSSIIEQAESAHRTLNSQIRPMLLAKSDQEAQMHYEQLSVILEYQLDGLRQLEQILFSGNVDQVDEAVQELAEVDTYLLAFQQDVEKS